MDLKRAYFGSMDALGIGGFQLNVQLFKVPID